MNKEMMSPSTISGFFASVILVLCLLIILHVGITLTRKKGFLRILKDQHDTLIHSLPMSLGMISTMTICSIIGSLLKANLSWAYMICLIIGVLLAAFISLPLYDTAIVDGIVAGSMGGLMGAMLGSMVPVSGLYTVTVLLTFLFIFAWVTMYRRIKKLEVASIDNSINSEQGN